MEDALSMDLECTSSFAFHRTYPDAPNPVLDIKGIGMIGLPLSLGDASAIKRQSSHASSDLDDPPVPPTSVQNTWEIDGRLVSCVHRLWYTKLRLVFLRLRFVITIGPSSWSGP